MKHNIQNTILFLAACALAAASCSSQDDIYKQWVKVGGYDYPAKPINLTADLGYQRVIVNWEKPMDPAVKTAVLYWDNYTDSVGIDYADYPEGKVSIEVTDLEDRAYTFDIVNHDANGNVSLASEMTVTPYGAGWLVSRSERTVSSAVMDGSDGKVTLSKSTDQMVATRFRYKNQRDEWVDCETVMKPGETEVIFPDALRGKRFQYASAYKPSDCLDTVWRSWTTSVNGLRYQINGLRWNCTATTNQSFSEYTPDKIFDGRISSTSRWHSSRSDATKLVFPKIIAIDTQAPVGEEYAFTDFEFYQHTDQPTMRYIREFSIYVGDTPFDPNDADYLNNFGIPFYSGSLSQATATFTASASRGAEGRYIAIVFTNSWSTDGYVDLWELIPYGYIPSQAD